MSISNILLWICRIVAAIILLQTLFYKFSASPESVYIFSQVGIEPWGRIGTGILELVAAILLLGPRTSVIGAALAAGLMTGAIITHLFILGVEVMDDGGLLFIYALIVLLASLYIYIVENAIAIIYIDAPLIFNISNCKCNLWPIMRVLLSA